MNNKIINFKFLKNKKYKLYHNFIIEGDTLDFSAYTPPDIMNKPYKKKFIDKLVELMNTSKYESLNTFVDCSLCNYSIYSRVYFIFDKNTIQTYKILSNYIHYLEDHNIYPSKNFIKFIKNIDPGVMIYNRITKPFQIENKLFYEGDVYIYVGKYCKYAYNLINIHEKKYCKFFINKIKYLIKFISNENIIDYKISIPCSFCYKKIYIREYIFQYKNINFIILSSYLHYLEQHYIYPSKEFIFFISKII